MTRDEYPGRLSAAEMDPGELPDGPSADDFCRGCGEERGMDDPPFADGMCVTCWRILSDSTGDGSPGDD